MLKATLVTIAIILTVGLTVWVLSPKSPSQINIENRIDSLCRIDDSLKYKQFLLDSAINEHEDRISGIEDSIATVRTITITINKNYHDTITYIDKFGLQQLDSFFKTRYAY
jgi:hypothetical protein